MRSSGLEFRLIDFRALRAGAETYGRRDAGTHLDGTIEAGEQVYRREDAPGTCQARELSQASSEAVT